MGAAAAAAFVLSLWMQLSVILPGQWGDATLPPGYGRLAVGVSGGVVFVHLGEEVQWKVGLEQHWHTVRPVSVEWLPRQVGIDSGTGIYNFGIASFGRPPVMADRILRLAVWPWVIVLVVVGVLMVLSGRKAARRVREGLCLACGYDLGGLGVGAVCPECGRGTT